MRRRSIDVAGLDHGGQPFPAACVVGRLVQTSALHAMCPENGEFADSIEDQVAQVFENARRVLRAAGAGLEDVVSVDVLIADAASRDVVNRYWVQAFPDPASCPARHTTVSPLRSPLLVQLKLTAYLSEDPA